MTAESKRIGDLQPGDLTANPGGGCARPCPDYLAPWRVEKTEPWPSRIGIDVTWSHPPCGEVAPRSCDRDSFVAFFGRSQ
jgi:hypothetical protein